MELRDYVRVLRSRIKLIAVCVGVVVVLSIVASLLQEPQYESIAEVVVEQKNTGIAMLGTPQPENAYTPGRDDVDTQVQVIQSARIAGQVKRDLGLTETATSLLDRVEASSDTGTNIISISVMDPSSDGAARIANAFAEAYISWSRESQRASIKAAADDVESRLITAQEQIVALETTGPGAEGTAAHQVKLDAAKSLYASLSDKLEELRIAEQLATGKGNLLTSAESSSKPASPSYPRNMMLGLSFGILVGLGAAFVAEQFDKPIRSAQEATTAYGAPVLATVPLDRSRQDASQRLAVNEPSGSPSAEAYRMLRTNLEFIDTTEQARAVLIASAVPGEGKSTVAANLACVLARAGSRVALVICDFHVPAAERFFAGLDYSVGLAEVLSGADLEVEPLQRPHGHENLWVLPPGEIPADPSKLLASEAMGVLMETLRETVDWVVLDSAPVLATADAGAVARWVDGVLIVSRVGDSRHEASRAARAQLDTVGARVLGLVVLGPLDAAASAGYYGYHASARTPR